MTDSSAGHFRQDLNGLRAVAVLSVLLFHFDVPYFTGGFVGVDVFFVLSGFLMTQIILTALQSGTFSFITFYLRRLARILPALLILAAVSLMLGYALLLPDGYERLADEALQAVAFWINVNYAKTTGYFAVDPTQSWLLHCWSLAVEFQFYLIYPALLSLVWRLGKTRAMLLALILVTAISVVYSYTETRQDQMAAFFLLPARAWEFAAGGLLVFLPLPAQRWRTAIALTGLAIIVLADTVFDGSLVYPSLWSTIPVAGACLVIGANSRSMALNNPVFQLVGTISYSMYLWHWPVVVLAKYAKYGHGLMEMFLLFSMVLVISLASYRIVEVPWKNAFRRNYHVRTGQLALCAAVVLGSSLAVASMQGLPSRLSGDMLELVGQAHHSTEYRDGVCFLNEGQAFSALAPECLGSEGHGGKPVLALWGDSLTAHLYPGIAAQPWARNYDLVQITASACSPQIDTYNPLRPFCPEIRRQAESVIKALHPDILILGANDNASSSGFGALVRTMRDSGVKSVVVVGPLPRWNPQPAQTIFLQTRFHPKSFPQRSTPMNLKALRAQDASYGAQSLSAGASYLSMQERLCSNDRCLTNMPGELGLQLLQFDEVHFTRFGSEWAASQVIGPALGYSAPSPPQGLPYGTPIEFSEGSSGTRYLRRGWMPPEGWGTWTASKKEPGVIRLPIAAGSVPSAIRLEFWGQLGPTLDHENFSVRLAGSSDLALRVDKAHPIVVRDLLLDPAQKAQVASVGYVELQFTALEGKSSKEMGLNNDERVLGFGIRTIALIP